MIKLSDMKNSIIIVVITFIGFVSCSDNCTTCVQENVQLEICDDSDLIYSDLDGNEISNETFIENLEMMGYTCN